MTATTTNSMHFPSQASNPLSREPRYRGREGQYGQRRQPEAGGALDRQPLCGRPAGRHPIRSRHHRSGRAEVARDIHAGYIAPQSVKPFGCSVPHSRLLRMLPISARNGPAQARCRDDVRKSRLPIRTQIPLSELSARYSDRGRAAMPTKGALVVATSHEPDGGDGPPPGCLGRARAGPLARPTRSGTQGDGAMSRKRIVITAIALASALAASDVGALAAAQETTGTTGSEAGAQPATPPNAGAAPDRPAGDFGPGGVPTKRETTTQPSTTPSAAGPSEQKPPGDFGPGGVPTKRETTTQPSHPGPTKGDGTPVPGQGRSSQGH